MQQPLSSSVASRLCACACLSALAATPALADILDFEDVATPVQSVADYGQVLDGYHGFDWASNGPGSPGLPAGEASVYLNNITVNSGYQTAIPVGTRAMFTPGGIAQSLCILTMTRAETWDFHSVDIATAWRTGVLVEITGLVAGSTIYSHTFTIESAGVLSTLSLNFTGIETLRIRSSGGTTVYSGGNGAHLILDNMNYSVPTPGALALVALAGMVQRRRR